MANYARKADGCWIDVFQVPSEYFSSVSDLEKKLGVTGFFEVDDACIHGDFIGDKDAVIARASVIVQINVADFRPKGVVDEPADQHGSDAGNP